MVTERKTSFKAGGGAREMGSAISRRTKGLYCFTGNAQAVEGCRRVVSLGGAGCSQPSQPLQIWERLGVLTSMGSLNTKFSNYLRPCHNLYCSLLTSYS